MKDLDHELARVSYLTRTLREELRRATGRSGIEDLMDEMERRMSTIDRIRDAEMCCLLKGDRYNTRAATKDLHFEIDALRCLVRRLRKEMDYGALIKEDTLDEMTRVMATIDRMRDAEMYRAMREDRRMTHAFGEDDDLEDVIAGRR